ncbi:hypothetical protein K493DRAFT_360293 [Basidiobolus meristosporus CBS 931.73]|uniref:Uncharacterized protein n=1 Tax=Basidiobolus meristosporus CBS 931.73 TaxID=1314790 RepID=A0A1Y1XJQ9_9FUNG|nr:hypothetical protein K493DRAFT_360293 [Basidiobolus meristosporus CBS 931.73]|eukprot:ORX85952.1 hypothetical protein K493DRAFT_360293 [Basidiobolus meristosporus CBS 931.73]
MSLDIYQVTHDIELHIKRNEATELAKAIEVMRKTNDEAACANNEKNEAILSEREHLRIQLSKYQEMLDKSQSEINVLKESLSKEQNMLESLRKEITLKSDECQKQRLEFEKYKADLSLQNQQTNHLLEDARNTIENLMREKSTQVHQLEEELSYSRTRENEYKLTIQDMDRRVDSLQVSIEKNINDHELERRSWKQNTDNLDSHIQGESLKTITGLREQIESLKVELNSVFVSQESEAVKNLKLELQDKENQNQSQKTSSEKKIKSLEDEVEALHIEINKNEANYLNSLEELKAEHNLSAEKHQKTEDNYKAVESERQSLLRKHEAFSLDIAALKKENEELKKRVTNSGANISQELVDTKLQQQAQQFEDFWRREESQLRNDLQKKSHQIESLVKELGNNRAEKISLERALKESQLSIETLKKMVENGSKQNGNPKILSLSEISNSGGRFRYNESEGNDTEDLTLDIEADDDIDFKSTAAKNDKGKKEPRGKSRIPTRRSSRARTIKQSVKDKSGESSTEMTLFE